MNCTLDICGDKQIQNPTPADIQQAVSGLNTKKNDAFLILSLTDMTYIQTTGDQKVGFDLEYQDTDTAHHYRATRDFTAGEIVHALTLYSTGSPDWKNVAAWEQIEV